VQIPSNGEEEPKWISSCSIKKQARFMYEKVNDSTGKSTAVFLDFSNLERERK
jgi:hypothetical protein